MNDRRLGLVELACALASAGLIAAIPHPGGWPLLLALLPIIWRVAHRRIALRPTPFDLPLIVFSLTALAGVWAAYNRESAWDKFWVIVSAVALYYAIAGQPRENLWPLAGGLGGISALIGGYFVLTCDWQVQPADVSVINLVGLGWMRIRPTLPGYLHPNLAGGLLAMLMPFSIAFGLRVWRKRQSRLQLYALVVTGITLFSLFMTSSRGAWLALAAGLIVWSAWGLSALASRWSDQPRNLIFVTAMVVLGLIIGLVIWNFPGGLIGLANRLPGLASGTSRWELAVNTYHLALDYPFTGGGLRAFEGLYSRYARIIQVPEFTYSHNFYTDVLLEQGLFGLIALASLLIGSLVLLMVYPGRTLPKIKPSLGQLRWATAVSLITLGLHGLVDDALYGNAGTPLLFVWAGLAVATTQPWTWFERPASPTWRPRKLTAGIGLSLLVLLGIFSRSIFASVYANWGAVEMSRAQLMGWPEHTEMDAAAQARFDASTSWFERALQWDAENNAAHYRLGLMAYRRGDFAMARSHLENAYLAWPGHYGVRKVLGYTIGWLGETEQAVILLTTIPEAQSELNTYAWWWATQGRDDLSGYASQMAIHLAEDIKETSTSTRSGP